MHEVLHASVGARFRHISHDTCRSPDRRNCRDGTAPSRSPALRARIQWLEHLAPFRKDYKHHNTGEDNGDSHLKALLIHHEVIVPITGGKLDLGTWQRIFYAEFDGKRDKRVIVKVMGE